MIFLLPNYLPIYHSWKYIFPFCFSQHTCTPTTNTHTTTHIYTHTTRMKVLYNEWFWFLGWNIFKISDGLSQKMKIYWNMRLNIIDRLRHQINHHRQKKLNHKNSNTHIYNWGVTFQILRSSYGSKKCKTIHNPEIKNTFFVNLIRFSKRI